MHFGEILMLAVGLAMDATAVAATRGMMVSAIRLRHVLIVAAFFGGFQALMPLAGWLLGKGIGPLVEAWDHWIAFVLLGGIGGKMLWEAREMKKDDEDGSASAADEEAPFAPRAMLILAVATSIDALAAGFTLPMLDASLFTSLFTIGVTTAVLSVIGLFAGRRFGAMLGRRLDVFGGLILIGLGVKVLVEHLRAG